MNKLQIFKNEQFGEIRTIIKDGQPWFVAKDLCEVLELTNTTVSIARLDSDEVTKFNLGGLSGEINIVNESGLYSLVMGSRKPEAKQFKKWVTGEVLPAIRKTGGYVSNEDLFINTYLPYVDDNTKLIFRNTLGMVRKQNEIIAMKDKVIEHKEEVIVGLVDEITLAEKRQVLNRVVRYRGANFQERWRELYKQFEMKYHINLKDRLEKYNMDHKPKLKNKVDYIDKVMSKVPELYEIACKLYENDVKELAAQIYEIA